MTPIMEPASPAPTPPTPSPADAHDLLDTPAAGPAAIRGAALRVVGYVVGIGLSVGSSALLFRHLGVVSSGHYITILSLVTLAAGITDAGLSGIGVRELSTLDPRAGRRLFANLFGIRMVLSAAGLLLALCFALLSYSSVLVLGTLVAGGGVLLQTSQDSFAIPLQARLRFGWVTGVDMVRQLVTAAGIVLLVLLGAPLLPFWATAVAGGLAATCVGAYLVRRSTPLIPAFDRAVWAPLLRDTLPYALAAAVGAIYYRLAILIVSLVASGRQLGYFGASYRVMDVLIVIPQLLVGASFPIFARAARDDRERFDYATGRMLDVCFLLGLTACLGLLTGAPFIITVIAGAKFAAAAAVLRIQGFALIGSFVAAVFGYGLLGLHRYRATLVVNLSVLVFSGVLTTVLAARDGATGAATSVAIAEALYAVMLGVAMWRAGARPRIATKIVPRALLAAGLGALALLPAHLPEVVRPLLALAVYGGALLVLRAIPREILEQMPTLRRRTAS
jgi:O-antigen/teichoic acid export membrane protein